MYTSLLERRARSFSCTTWFLLIVTVIAMIILLNEDPCGKSISNVAPPRRINLRLVNTEKGIITYHEIGQSVYFRYGLSISKATVPLPILVPTAQSTCQQIFFAASIISRQVPSSPPLTMGTLNEDDYKMHGYAHVIMNATSEKISANAEDWSKVGKEYKKDALTDDQKTLLGAIEDNGVQNKIGIVTSSISPWIEAFVLEKGAEKVVTVTSLSGISSFSSKLIISSWDEIDKQMESNLNKFDFAVSSNLAEIGFGRMGDAVDPQADIREVSKVHCLLKDGGLLFISLPRAKDTIIFNRVRYYGRLRIPMLIHGFELVTRYRPLIGQNLPNVTDFNSVDPQTDIYVLRKLKLE